MVKPEAHQRVVLKSLHGAEVPVRVLVNERASRISVRIDPKTREAIATAPSRKYALEALTFATERVEWIAERLDALPMPVRLQPGVSIPLRGEPHLLKSIDKGRGVRLDTSEDTPCLLVPGRPESFGSKMRGFLRNAARADFSERVAVHAETLGVKPRSIAIKDMRSRWGSCSSEGRLNFSWRLICAPPFALDYVAAHEVAHLREMNHSKRFWAHVETCIPDWETARKWLHERGAALHAITET